MRYFPFDFPAVLETLSECSASLFILFNVFFTSISLSSVKVRHYAPKWLIRTIYYTLFNSRMIYGCQTWGQHKTNLVKRVMKLQEKAIRLINFKDNNNQVSNLFAQNKILEFEDFVHYWNINLVKNSTEKMVLPHLTISSFEHKKFTKITLEVH